MSKARDLKLYLTYKPRPWLGIAMKAGAIAVTLGVKPEIAAKWVTKTSMKVGVSKCPPASRLKA